MFIYFDSFSNICGQKVSSGGHVINRSFKLSQNLQKPESGKLDFHLNKFVNIYNSVYQLISELSETIIMQACALDSSSRNVEQERFVIYTHV